MWHVGSGVSAGEVVGEVAEVVGEVAEVVEEIAEVVGEVVEVPDAGVVTSLSITYAYKTESLSLTEATDLSI